MYLEFCKVFQLLRQAASVDRHLVSFPRHFPINVASSERILTALRRAKNCVRASLGKERLLELKDSLF